MHYLVTGSAGFIGFHVTKALLKRGDSVTGIDNFNNYYDPTLKEARNKVLKDFYDDYDFHKVDISELDACEYLFKEHTFDKVCHLAAQAGVRYSITNPFVYESSNIQGFLNVMHMAKENDVKNFVYASSSSVYGGNKKIPFSEDDPVDEPISLYAATKKSNELMAHTYHHLFDLNCTGLRFFTVYGPYGRPDMAYYLFTKNILEGKEIDVYNFGNMRRDFTYVDDIAEGVLSALDKDFKYEIFNLGNNDPVELNYFIETLEKTLDVKAKKKLLPMQPGDVPETYADIEKAKRFLDYSPQTGIEDGIKLFVEWYKDYYNLQ